MTGNDRKTGKMGRGGAVGVQSTTKKDGKKAEREGGGLNTAGAVRKIQMVENNNKEGVKEGKEEEEEDGSRNREGSAEGTLCLSGEVEDEQALTAALCMQGQSVSTSVRGGQ